MIPYIIGAIIGIAIGILIGYFVRKNIAEAKIKTAEDAAAKILIDAKKESEARKKEAVLEVKDEIYRLRNEADRDFKERRSELQRMEKRAVQKEETLDRKLETFERKEENFAKKEQEIEQKKQEIIEIHQRRTRELEAVSGLTTQEAKDILLATISDEIKHEAAIMIRDIENEAKEEEIGRASCRERV